MGLLMNKFIRQKAVKYKINKLNIKDNIVKMREDDYKLMLNTVKRYRKDTPADEDLTPKSWEDRLLSPQKNASRRPCLPLQCINVSSQLINTITNVDPELSSETNYKPVQRPKFAESCQTIEILSFFSAIYYYMQTSTASFSSF
jgi:hypothetical protein